MAEIYLGEDDEERLKRQAIDNVFLALMSEFIQSSRDPNESLKSILNAALEISTSGNHSEDAETNDYSRKLVAENVKLYLDQFKLR